MNSDGDRVTKPYHIGWRPSQPASRPWRWRDRRPRRPWQSEGGTGLRFARRGFTAEGAERAMKRDIAHLRRTGKSSPKQRWLVWRVSWVARRMVKRGEWGPWL
jgi:hypothetical protein